MRKGLGNDMRRKSFGLVCISPLPSVRMGEKRPGPMCRVSNSLQAAEILPPGAKSYPPVCYIKVKFISDT